MSQKTAKLIRKLSNSKNRVVNRVTENMLKEGYNGLNVFGKSYFNSEAKNKLNGKTDKV